MSRKALFEAIRPFAPDGRLTAAHVLEIDGLADRFGLPREAQGGADPTPDRELIAALKVDEGLRLKAYKDTEGVWTIGYGHTGKEVRPGLVWTQVQALAALEDDARDHNADLAAVLPWISRLDPVRRRVLQNMAFNLGLGSAATGKGLLGFRNTLEYVRTGDYARAADGMMASKWARQVKGRAVRLAGEMRTGRVA